MNDYYKVWKNASSVDIDNFFSILYVNKEKINEIDIEEIIKHTNTFLNCYSDIDISIKVKIKNFIKYLKVFTYSLI